MKNLGILIIVLAAVGLIASYYVGGLCSNNAYTASMMALLVVGLVTHIILNKKYTE